MDTVQRNPAALPVLAFWTIVLIALLTAIYTILSTGQSASQDKSSTNQQQQLQTAEPAQRK
jgi:uncharacterized membrane protein